MNSQDPQHVKQPANPANSDPHSNSAAFIVAIQQMQERRDPKRITLADRRFYRDNADALRRYARIKRDPGLHTTWDVRLSELKRARRASASLASAWLAVVRNTYLQANATPVYVRGVLVIYVANQSAKYLMEREMRAGGWTELQRALPVAMNKYRVQVGPPPEQAFQVPPPDVANIQMALQEDEGETPK